MKKELALQSAQDLTEPLLQLHHLAQQFHHPSFQLDTWQTGRIGGRWHATSESCSPASVDE